MIDGFLFGLVKMLFPIAVLVSAYLVIRFLCAAVYWLFIQPFKAGYNGTPL